ncbi:Hypothetical predicted protein [Paramuricea clavata]|uniref:Uncharacterized protein n=1 Tax=Paramuricea clavata TaxID=317549 RepID=A0A7D9HJ95_PARCT|nr:Hypothetical predicted protein [Paramuricea clavata]
MTATVDNIDHNPNSTTAQRAFHGTGISLFQDPSENITGEERDVINVENTSKKRLSQLSESYTTVKPVIIPKKEPPVPAFQGPFVSSCLPMPSAFVTEYKWLNNIGTKPDLLSCSEKISPIQAEAPPVDALLLDGAAIVNMLNPGTSRTFEEYSQDVFLPYVKAQLVNVRRVDVVWDTYIEDSLRATTRSNRGKGIRLRVKPDTNIPDNWAAF